MTDRIEPPELAPVRPGRGAGLGRRWRPTCSGRSPSWPARWRCCSSRAAPPTSPTCCASATPSWCCGGRRSAWWRPGAHDMRREYRVLSRLWRNFDRAPRAYVFCDDHDVIGADFVVMERRRGEVVRGVIPASMAHHPDVGRRISFALVDAMADMHLLDPAANDLERPRQAGRLRRPPGGRVEDALGPRASRRRAAAHGRGARAAGGVGAGADPGVDRAQRPQARQLPVRPGRPRPGAVDLRLGHDHAGRAAGRPRHAAQLLARSVRPARRPAGQPRGHADDGPADAGRDHGALRRAHRHRLSARPVGTRRSPSGRRAS